jgi:hypothetical protein
VEVVALVDGATAVLGTAHVLVSDVCVAVAVFASDVYVSAAEEVIGP